MFRKLFNSNDYIKHGEMGWFYVFKKYEYVMIPS